MRLAPLIFETLEAFAARNADPYLGAWRAYHKALVEASVSTIENPKVVSREEWLAGRKKLLAKATHASARRSRRGAHRSIANVCSVFWRP
jgi:hypothetical protein